MKNRRQFIQKLIGAGAFLYLLSNPLLARAESIFGQAKNILAAVKTPGLRTPLADIRSSKVFLACKVNGEVLPEKNGYPLRVVAQDYVGDDWVKYVLKMDLIAE